MHFFCDPQHSQGCSAGVISIDLAKNLFKGRPNSLALIVSTENLTEALYVGNDRSFLVQNTLFRCGGAAMILSNRFLDSYRAHFKLLTTVRTHYVSQSSMECVYQTEDDLANTGVRLSKDIVKVAGQAMEKNFTAIGPYVLPFSEQFKVIGSLVAKYFFKLIGSKSKVSMYMPDFKRGIDHFCVHAGDDTLLHSATDLPHLLGGRGVIDGVEKNLKLSPQHVEASRYALHTSAPPPLSC
jgi:predicted naringenin-chalcone synthase